MAGITPLLNSQRCCIRHNAKPEQYQRDIRNLHKRTRIVRAPVQQWWINKHQRDAREASDERHKLIQIISASPRYQRSDEHRNKAECVLLPFDARVVFATAREEAGFHDTDGREELEGRREKDCDRVEELDTRIIIVSCIFHTITEGPKKRERLTH